MSGVIAADKKTFPWEDSITAFCTANTENKIAFSRQAYNDQTLFFNNKIQMFPSNVVSMSFNFKAGEFFEVEDKAERKAPKVDFS